MAAILASSLLAGCNRMEEVSGAPSDTAAASTAEDPFVLGVSQIGRASCRERVY